jgi:hydrogenase maturation protease
VSDPFAGALFIGVGEPARGDDGVGPWLAAALAARGRETATRPADGAEIAALLAGRPAAVLLDATRGGGPPGTLTILDLARTPLPAGLAPPSSHLIGLAEGVEIARALGDLPTRLAFFGIEGRDFALGADLSPPVDVAARTLLERLAPPGEPRPRTPPARPR